MKRSAMENLIAWKGKKHRKPLLLLGARQVGKTWLLNEFGKQHFSRVANIRLDRNPVMRTVFERDYNVNRILDAIQLEVSFKVTPQDTLVILDEIQTCPAAITALKYFCEDAPEYAIAAAGSLLGVAEHSGTGFPVGKVDRLYLYPMTFSEFLDATGNQTLAELIQARDWDMMKCFHEKLAGLLRYYYFIGGMPEAVASFAEEHDFAQVRSLQNQLLQDYSDDFEKHANKTTSAKIRMIWNSIPAQLARENKKFKYKDVGESMRSRDLEDAMTWLQASGMVHLAYRASKPGLPLSAYQDDAFKAYFLDVGLLAAKSQLNAKVLLDGNAVFQEFKGALTEQFVQQELRAEFGIKPAYWASKTSGGEVDFLVVAGASIIPVEVKAETNLQAKSLKAYCKKFKPKTALRISMGTHFKQDIPLDDGKSYELIDLPLYAMKSLSGIL